MLYLIPTRKSGGYVAKVTSGKPVWQTGAMGEGVEKKLVDLFRDRNELFFIACSSQNIDRIVSIYRACLRTNRIFVIDPYTALILVFIDYYGTLV